MLNTCLYKGGYSSHLNGVSAYVKDCLTNKEILSFLQKSGEEPLGLTPYQFSLQADALMADGTPANPLGGRE